MEKIIELDRIEMQNINGGGPVWRKSGEWIGALLDFVEDVYNSYTHTPEGQAVQQALKDFQ